MSGHHKWEDIKRRSSTVLMCAGCQRSPRVTHGEYVEGSGYRSADAYVWSEEGTLDRASGWYLCDACYIRYGMPVLDGERWTATPANLYALGIVV